MKKIFLVGVSFFCLSSVAARIPGSIDELKRSLKPLLLQKYDAKKYSWSYSSFKDIYKKNYSLYRNPSYIASQEIFVPLFEALNKRAVGEVKETLSVTYNKDQKIVVIGSLYGGFQCLIDYIDHWQSSGIISKELVLQKNYSMIFLGNAVGKSPYSQETLAIIGLLIYKNQSSVVYIQGEQEYQEAWLDHSMGNQIIKTQKPFIAALYKKLIQAFFASCPRSMHNIFDSKDTHKILCVSSQQQVSSNISFGADIVISGINDFIVRENNTGLFLMAPIRGATNWKVFSGCTPMMKEYYDFSTHSYVLFDQNSITHVYRPAGQKKYQQKVYNIYTGLLDTDKRKILKIGSSLDLSGQAQTIGVPVQEGIFASLLEQNNDKSFPVLIREYIFDDSYIPSKTYKNITMLKEQGIQTILIHMGTVYLDMYIHEFKDSSLSVLFPVANGRYPDIKNLIHYRVSFAQETDALIKNLLSKNYIKSIAIFYQDDAFGKPPRDIAHALLEAKKIRVIDVPYSRTDASFSAAVEKIKKSNVDAIAFFALTEASSSFIREYKPYNLANKKLLGLSTLLVNDFEKMVYNLGLDFTFASVVPDPCNSTLQIAQEYRSTMKKNAIVPDIASFEAYIATQLFLDAFKAAQYTLDQKKIMQHFEQMNHTNFKGLLLHLNAFRGLSNTVWLVEGPDVEWISYSLI
jgi:ABC-type branched-subunit amino acid transport system substrate-binding protein